MSAGSRPSTSTVTDAACGVDGLAALEDLRDVGPGEHGAVAVPGHPGPRLGVADPQEDDGNGREQLTGLGALGRAAAEREHHVGAAQQVGDHLVLQRAERGLAIGREDLRDAPARAGLDHVVAVKERHAQRAREQAAHGGLARAHEPREHDHARPGESGAAAMAATACSAST